MTTKTTPRLLLIGNGVNLVARSHSNISYNRLLRKAAKDKGVKIEESDSIDSLHEKLANYGYAHSNDNPYADIYPALSDLRPTYAHHLLSAFSHAFSHILTLNFDYAMERALGCRIPTGKENPLQSIPCLKGKKVCHIHGAVNREAPENSQCIISEASYREALALFPQNLPECFTNEQEIGKNNPWYVDFITKEVHICGAAMHENELLLWHVLELRKQWIKRQIGNTKWTNRIYVYLFQQPREKGRIQKIAQNLRDLSVTPIIIQVRNKMSSEEGFNAAWERLIGKLFLRVQNVYVYHDSLQNLPLGKTPNIRSQRRNVSISLSSDLRYPEWCVMRIPYKKLREEKLREKYWLFYCGIRGKVYFWRIPVEKLLNLAPAQEQEEENKRFVVYLDYKTGRLYHLRTQQASATCIKSRAKKFDSLIVTL